MLLKPCHHKLNYTNAKEHRDRQTDRETDKETDRERERDTREEEQTEIP